MWYKNTEHFPFGLREVRPLLVARGLFGFFGVFGMYCKSSSRARESLHGYSNLSKLSPRRVAFKAAVDSIVLLGELVCCAPQ